MIYINFIDILKLSEFWTSKEILFMHKPSASFHEDEYAIVQHNNFIITL